MPGTKARTTPLMVIMPNAQIQLIGQEFKQQRAMEYKRKGML